jgi:hypothetical protein
MECAQTLSPLATMSFRVSCQWGIAVFRIRFCNYCLSGIKLIKKEDLLIELQDKKEIITNERARIINKIERIKKPICYS